MEYERKIRKYQITVIRLFLNYILLKLKVTGRQIIQAILPAI